MSAPLRIALIGSYAPRQCGIATFSADVREALRSQPDVSVDIWPVRTAAELANHFEEQSMMEGDPASFRAAARGIEASGADIVILQHEFGLFGGSAGDAVLALVDALAVPLVTTLHTILAEPDPEQRRVMNHLAAQSAKLVVMTEYSRGLLQSVYGVDAVRIALIEHGVPDRPFGLSAHYKEKLGLSGPMLLTFGLLSPGKGIETAIAAMPEILAHNPDATYCIAGATHPNLIAHEGEKYRHQLQELSRKLKVEDRILWIDRFLDLPDLLDLIDAADIYITPYPGAAQSTSGTLSYAVALGKAVISTPYVHARDLLADGTGILVPFGDSVAISEAACDLLDHPRRLAAMQARAYARGRRMTWANYGADFVALAQSVRAEPLAKAPRAIKAPGQAALFELCDNVGIYQHGRYAVADRNHGYCIDDNVRALMLVNRLGDALGERGPQMTANFAAFIQHGWNPDRRVFRNFMDFSRRWLEDAGSEDSNGRTLWALGCTAYEAPAEHIRFWAADLYRQVSGIAQGFGSPRAIAFAMLGAEQFLKVDPDHGVSREMLAHGALRLRDLLASARRDGWTWFESGLAYDNARLPEAVIRAGLAIGDKGAIADGLESLNWLCTMQTARGGYFRPVGSAGFHLHYEPPLPFDQQPLEAWATIDACDAAFAATGDKQWIVHALAAWHWFGGANDLSKPLADVATGRCRDGLTPQGANLNSGAESVLAYQLAYLSIRALQARGGEV